MVRLSDEPETRMSLALSPPSGLKGRAGRVVLGARGYGAGCLAILGFEGERREVALRRSRALAVARECGAMTVGRSPGEAWRRSRFEAPYLRDELLTLGVMAETLETAAPWSALHSVHLGVREAIATALRAQGTPGPVMCHVSHVYESGASLYFTLLARQRPDAPIEQWEAVKQAAGEAILAAGGTITHHHAIGRDHARWMSREVSEEGMRALAAVKAELDPAGIMNPGKLFLSG